MYLLEHDAKQLLATHGVPLRRACCSTPCRAADTAARPWWSRPSAVGGRGKAGGIRKTAGAAETFAAAADILRTRIRDMR